MICFKDKSYCSAKCQTWDCHRQYNDTERVAARKWWGKDGSPPIAFTDFSDTCPQYKPIEEQANA